MTPEEIANPMNLGYKWHRVPNENRAVVWFRYLDDQKRRCHQMVAEFPDTAGRPLTEAEDRAKQYCEMLAERSVREEVPELEVWLCPVHKSLDERGQIRPLDNCVACIRVERDELRARIATLKSQLAVVREALGSAGGQFARIFAQTATSGADYGFPAVAKMAQEESMSIIGALATLGQEPVWLEAVKRVVMVRASKVEWEIESALDALVAAAPESWKEGK